MILDRPTIRPVSPSSNLLAVKRRQVSIKRYKLQRTGNGIDDEYVLDGKDVFDCYTNVEVPKELANGVSHFISIIKLHRPERIRLQQSLTTGIMVGKKEVIVSFRKSSRSKPKAMVDEMLTG